MIRAAVVFVFLACSPLALAAFNASKVETFDGTILDLGTWSFHGDQGTESATQNNALVLDSSHGIAAEYRSRYATIGVGGYAQVTATMTANSPTSWSVAHIYFGLNSQIPEPWGDIGTASRSVYINSSNDGSWFASEFTGSLAGGSGTGDQLTPYMSFQYNQPAILRMDYLTANTIQYRVFDPNMNLIGSDTRTLSNLPSRLYITLGSYYGTGNFDNVAIGGNADVPEPASTLGACALGVLVLYRRRRIKPQTLCEEAPHSWLSPLNFPL